MGATWAGVTSREDAAILWKGDRILVRKPGAGNAWATVNESIAWGSKVTLTLTFADGTQDIRTVRRTHKFTARIAA